MTQKEEGELTSYELYEYYIKQFDNACGTAMRDRHLSVNKENESHESKTSDNPLPPELQC